MGNSHCLFLVQHLVHYLEIIRLNDLLIISIRVRYNQRSTKKDVFVNNSISSTSAENNRNKRSPWAWLPSLYYAEGMPYILVMIVSVVMYKRLGVSNTDIALYTSWLYLPWTIKPLWSPIVDSLRTNK